MGGDDVLAVGTGHVKPDGSAAHGHDGRIRLHRAHERRGHLRVQVHGDLGVLLHLVHEIGQVALVVGAEDGAHLHAAAQARALLVEVHLVSALGRRERRVDAGRTRSHDHDLLRGVGLGVQLVVELGAQMRVHAAVDERQTAGHHIVDAAAAHDALAHVLGAVLHHLQRQGRIGDGVAQAGDDIALAVGQVLLHDGGVGVAVALAHGLFGHGLDLLGDVHPVTIFDALGGQRHARLMPAHRQVVQVETGLFHPHGDLLGLFHGQARAVVGLDEVHRRPAHHDGEIRADDLADAANDLQGEAGAVLQAAAVLVGAVVGGLAHEAAQDAAHAGHDLDSVEAGLLANAHGVEVLLFELLDLLQGHGLEAAHHRDNGDV